MMAMIAWKMRKGARSMYLSLIHANEKEKMAAKTYGGAVNSWAANVV